MKHKETLGKYSLIDRLIDLRYLLTDWKMWMAIINVYVGIYKYLKLMFKRHVLEPLLLLLPPILLILWILGDWEMTIVKELLIGLLILEWWLFNFIWVYKVKKKKWEVMGVVDDLILSDIYQYRRVDGNMQIIRQEGYIGNLSNKLK